MGPNSHFLPFIHCHVHLLYSLWDSLRWRKLHRLIDSPCQWTATASIWSGARSGARTSIIFWCFCNIDLGNYACIICFVCFAAMVVLYLVCVGNSYCSWWDKWLVDDVIWGGNVIYKTLFGGMLLSLCLCCLACMHL